MEYRRLGRSGLRVSAIGLGSWLTFGSRVDEETANRCFTRAYDLGINFFDTADVYGEGRAEEVLGEWMREVPRSDLVVGTKAYFATGEGPNDRGLSRKHIVEACEDSLRRLHTDYVDLYQCHRFDEAVPLEETLRALDDLVASGKVLYAGVSEWSADQLRRAAGLQARAGLRPLVSNQPQYSLVARRIEEEVLPTSRAVGIGQVVWSPLAGGVLTGKYEPGEPPPEGSRASDPETRAFVDRTISDELLEAVRELEREVAAPRDLTVAQACLAWVLARQGVASAIVGATKVQHVEENAAAVDARLDDEALARIEEIMGPHARAAQPGR